MIAYSGKSRDNLPSFPPRYSSRSITDALSEMGVSKISIDFSLVGNMKYYNGIAIKGFIEGVPQSVISGGQYDNLMKKMGRS